MAERESLFQFRDMYEIGHEYHRGWLVLQSRGDGVRLLVCERGLGHDEPFISHGHTLTLAEAAELRNALDSLLPDNVEATETPQWEPQVCDACGEWIRAEKDRNAGSYRSHGRLGRTKERRGTWHRRCTPKEFYDRWGSW